jgi:hypothetical protein
MQMRHVMLAMTALTFALLALSGIGFAQTQQPPADINPPTKEDTQRPSPPLTIAPTQNSKDEIEKEERVRKEKAEIDAKLAFETQRIADYTDRLATLTLWVVVVAVFQAIMFFVQLNYMRTTIRDAATAQRAYMSVELEGLHPLIFGGSTKQPKKHVVLGHVIFKNGGRLPARNFQWFVNIEQDSNALRENFPIPDTDQFEGTTVIAPGGEIKFGTDKITLQPKGWIFVWGAVNYHDGFESGRVTRFCHRYNRAVLRRVNGGYGIPRDFGRVHRYGNDST